MISLRQWKETFDKYHTKIMQSIRFVAITIGNLHICIASCSQCILLTLLRQPIVNSFREWQFHTEHILLCAMHKDPGRNLKSEIILQTQEISKKKSNKYRVTMTIVHKIAKCMCIYCYIWNSTKCYQK